VRHPDMTLRREVLRVVEGRERHVEIARPPIVRVTDRGAASAAEGAQHALRRSHLREPAGHDLEAIRLERRPRDAVRARGEPTAAAVAVAEIARGTAHAIADLPAEAPALVRPHRHAP